MADREEESTKSAEAEEPLREPGTTPDPADKMSLREKTYLTLGTLYYGSHIAHWAWLQAQERAYPLVQHLM